MTTLQRRRERQSRRTSSHGRRTVQRPPRSSRLDRANERCSRQAPRSTRERRIGSARCRRGDSWFVEESFLSSSANCTLTTKVIQRYNTSSSTFAHRSAIRLGASAHPRESPNSVPHSTPLPQPRFPCPLPHRTIQVPLSRSIREPRSSSLDGT